MTETHAVIIDDNEMGLKVLAQMLEMNGITYTAIQKPKTIPDTLKMLEKVDVIFLDLEMPELDGYQVLRIIKEELAIQAPVVAYTVHISEVHEARELGFDGFIAKPLRIDRFARQLKDILQGVPVWDIS